MKNIKRLTKRLMDAIYMPTLNEEKRYTTSPHAMTKVNTAPREA